MKKSKFAFILTLLAAVGGGWYFLKHFDLKGIEGISLSPRTTATSGSEFYTAPPVQRAGDTIRIASFNIQVFGESKSQKPHVMEKLATIVRSFDVIAIQEIRTRDDGHIPRFVDMINATGRRYDFVIGPRLGRSVSTEQYAYIFDTQSVEVDRRQLYTVEDPDDLLHRQPLVGWFRVRGPDPSQAFTFTLVNIHTDPDEVDRELNVLDDVFIAVQNDGRNEDDVIILGDLNVDDRHLGELGQLPNISWCISGVPTNVRGTQLYDNLVFSKRSTVEFTGRAGVYDYMREFNLSQEQALEISDHIPVWAEFSLYEGGVPGRVATLPSATR